MPGMIFAFLMSVVSLGAVILMIVLFTQAQNRAATRRQDAFYKALEMGVYDQRLLGEKKRGHALLGWGIIFVATGLGILIGLGSMTDPMVLRNGGITGAMIPMLIGAGMILFYFLVRKLGNGKEKNGQPVVFDRKDGSAPPRIDG
ncbi:MAG: DUF6249 domain-containing protein [Candidatus Eisenbacteria bacterium]